MYNILNPLGFKTILKLFVSEETLCLDFNETHINMISRQSPDARIQSRIIMNPTGVIEILQRTDPIKVFINVKSIISVLSKFVSMGLFPIKMIPSDYTVKFYYINENEIKTVSMEMRNINEPDDMEDSEDDINEDPSKPYGIEYDHEFIVPLDILSQGLSTACKTSAESISIDIKRKDQTFFMEFHAEGEDKMVSSIIRYALDIKHENRRQFSYSFTQISASILAGFVKCISSVKKGNKNILVKMQHDLPIGLVFNCEYLNCSIYVPFRIKDDYLSSI